MKKITKYFLSFIPAVLLFVFFVISPAHAMSVKSGDFVTLPQDQTISETILVTGSTITVDSDINGDLFCAGKDVIVNGDIKGDVLCAAQTIKINGSVDGNIRSAAQMIEVYGTVTRNLMVASQQLVLGPKSNIKGDVIFGVQKVDLNGQMGRDLSGVGDTINITGSLLRNAIVTGSKITVIETGKIGGNLDYYVTQDATASIEAKNVKGNIVRHDITPSEKTVTDKQMVYASKWGTMLAKFFGIISYLVLGLVIVFFDKKNTELRVSKILTQPFLSGLIGFASLIFFPMAFVIVILTFVGLPLAVVASLLYLIGLITASLYASIAYGRLIFEKLLRQKKSSLVLPMVLGVIVLGLIVCLPVIGWFFGFISFCLGLGAFITSLFPAKAQTA